MNDPSSMPSSESPLSVRLLPVLLLLALLLALLLIGCPSSFDEGGDPAAGQGSVEPSELIPRQAFFGSAHVRAVRLSPDGRHVSWVGVHEGRPNLWVMDVSEPGYMGAEGEMEKRPVTSDRGRGIYFYEWMPDGRHLLYLQDAEGNEIWRLHLLDLETGESRPLTPEGVRARILGTSPERPGQVLVGLHQRDPRVPDIYWIDTTKPIDGSESAEPELLLENTDGFSDFVVDEQLRPRFAERILADGGVGFYELEVDEGAQSGEWVERFVVPAEDQMTTDLLSVVGQTAYLKDSRGRDTAALVAIDLETGQQADQEKELYRHPRADVEEVLFDPRSGAPQAVMVTAMRREWHALDAATEDALQSVSALDDGELVVAGRSNDGQRWLVADVSPVRPASYRLWVRDEAGGPGQAHFLFQDRPELGEGTLAPMHPVVILARDGLELPSYLSLPVGSDADGNGWPEEPLPLVLLVHGGPWKRDVYVNHPNHQHLANRGYAVLSVNFRGSTGFGKAFLNAGDLEWGAKMQDDLADAVLWAVDQGIADAERVAIMGASYGGYATLMGLVRDPELFACGIDIVGPSNLLTLAGSFPPRWQPRLDIWAHRMGDWRTEEGRALLEERSPLGRVDRLEDPLMIIHGANDTRVTLSESEQIVAALESKEIPVVFAVFPDEGHTFRRPGNILALMALTEHFLADCLGGRTEPFGAVFEGTSFEVRSGREAVEGLEAALEARDGMAEPEG